MKYSNDKEIDAKAKYLIKKYGHHKFVRDILKIVVTLQYDEIVMYLKIWNARMRSLNIERWKNKEYRITQEIRDHATIIKAIKRWMGIRDFIGEFQRNVKEHGYENEPVAADEYGKLSKETPEETEEYDSENIRVKDYNDEPNTKDTKNESTEEK